MKAGPLQGLVPGVDLIGFIGPAKAVPFYKALGIGFPMSFSAVFRAVPSHRALRSTW